MLTGRRGDDAIEAERPQSVLSLVLLGPQNSPHATFSPYLHCRWVS